MGIVAIIAVILECVLSYLSVIADTPKFATIA